MFRLLPALGLALIPSAPLPKDDIKPEPPSLVGEWVAETVTASGRTEPANPKNPLVYAFSADGELLIRNGPTWRKCKYVTDAKKEPAALDFGETLAIYKIEKDMLTVCSYLPGFGGKPRPAGRPTAFEAPAGSHLALLTFRRADKAKE